MKYRNLEPHEIIEAGTKPGTKAREEEFSIWEVRREVPDICPGCKHEIDTQICHCGDSMKNHTQEHSAVPRGCTCGYVTEEEEARIMANLANRMMLLDWEVYESVYKKPAG